MRVVNLFVHDNGNATVASALRSGHTAMYRFFNSPDPRTNRLDVWKQATNQRVIVLRHPVERMNSSFEVYGLHVEPVLAAMQGLPESERKAAAEAYIQSTPDIENTVIGTQLFDLIYPTSDDPAKVFWSKQFFIFATHSQIYMDQIKDLDFKYIDFSELDQYIPYGGKVTNTTDRSYDQFFPNLFYTLEELEQEVTDYNWILANKQKITVQEWQALTT